jgi:hypothetical protein
MKMNKRILALFVLSSAFLITACKDDTIDPIPGGGNAVTCQLLETKTDDGSTSTYTWDGDKLVKLTEKDSFGTWNVTFIYANDMLSEIVDGDVVSKITNSNGNVSKIEVFDNGDLWEVYDITYANGKLDAVNHFDVDMGTNILYETYKFTWTGDNVTKIVNNYDDDGDGTLDTEVTTSLTSFDDKINPYYGMPIVWLDLDNLFSFSKNNMTSGTYGTDQGVIALTNSIEYNEHKYPTKVDSDLTFFGKTVTTFTYDCK